MSRMDRQEGQAGRGDPCWQQLIYIPPLLQVYKTEGPPGHPPREGRSVLSAPNAAADSALQGPLTDYVVRPDGDADSVSKKRKAWLLANVGLAAERAIQKRLGAVQEQSGAGQPWQSGALQYFLTQTPAGGKKAPSDCPAYAAISFLTVSPPVQSPPLARSPFPCRGPRICNSWRMWLAPSPSQWPRRSSSRRHCGTWTGSTRGHPHWCRGSCCRRTRGGYLLEEGPGFLIDVQLMMPPSPPPLPSLPPTGWSVPLRLLVHGRDR